MSTRTLDSFQQVLTTLRYPSSELQTSQAIEAFAKADTRFAASFSNLALRVAGSTVGRVAARALDFPQLAGELRCTREYRTGTRATGTGRCDLWFETSDAGGAITLAIELKHYAPYTRNQRERYLRELGKPKYGRSALLVITGHNMPTAARSVLDNPRWLGEISWESLYDAGLLDCPFQNAALATLWQAFVKTLLADGDLGGIITAEIGEVQNWIAQQPGSDRWSTWQVLTSVEAPALAALNARLKLRGLTGYTIAGNRSGDAVYSRGRNYMSLGFAWLPRAAASVEITLWRSDDADLRAHLQIEFYPAKAQRAALVVRNGPRRHGFRWDKDDRCWRREFRVDVSTFASAEAFRTSIIHEWTQTLTRLVRLGAFEHVATVGSSPPSSTATRAGATHPVTIQPSRAVLDDLGKARARRARAARKYRPARVRTLLIAEAPPPSPERYFYFENVSTQDALFRHVAREILGVAPARAEKTKSLAALRDKGVYLIDLMTDPVGGSHALRNAVPTLVRRAKTLQPDKVILIKATVYDVAFIPLRDAGVPVVDVRVPFPGSGRQRLFEIAFRRALAAAP